MEPAGSRENRQKSFAEFIGSLLGFKSKKVTAMHEIQGEIIMYGSPWCGDTRRARIFFDQNQISYRWVDIDKDTSGLEFVKKVNNGNRSVPTIVFPDGSILVEPSLTQLSDKLKKSE